jgi:hypothetical protein
MLIRNLSEVCNKNNKYARNSNKVYKKFEKRSYEVGKKFIKKIARNTNKVYKVFKKNLQ